MKKVAIICTFSLLAIMFLSCFVPIILVYLERPAQAEPSSVMRWDSPPLKRGVVEVHALSKGSKRCLVAQVPNDVAMWCW